MVPTRREPVRDPSMVVHALLRACRADPDQRVMQIIVNAIGADPFYVDDDEAARRLHTYAEKMRDE